MKITASRTELILLSLALFILIALAVSPAWWSSAFGHDASGLSRTRIATDTTRASPNARQSTSEKQSDRP